MVNIAFRTATPGRVRSPRPRVVPRQWKGCPMQATGRTTAPPRRTWPQVFGVGLLLWLATAVVTLLTGNTNLVPTLVLLGSFLVPATFVVWALERYRDE